MPFRVPSADPGRVIFLVCCIGLAGLGPLYVWWSERPGAAGAVQHPASVAEAPSEELLALRAENRLLLAMLGAVESRVFVLGPTGSGGVASGKIAWDEARQAGFIHVTRLAPAKAGSSYRLAAVTRAGERIGCGPLSVSEKGTVASPFGPESRLLGVERFEVVLVPAKAGQGVDTVVLRAGGGE